MIDDIRNFLRDHKASTDQALHFAWSFLALIPIVWIGGIWGGLLSGLLIGLPRELVDQWPVGHWGDTLLDLAFFAAGGAVIGAII